MQPISSHTWEAQILLGSPSRIFYTSMASASFPLSRCSPASRSPPSPAPCPPTLILVKQVQPFTTLTSLGWGFSFVPSFGFGPFGFNIRVLGAWRIAGFFRCRFTCVGAGSSSTTDPLVGGVAVTVLLLGDSKCSNVVGVVGTIVSCCMTWVLESWAVVGALNRSRWFASVVSCVVEWLSKCRTIDGCLKRTMRDRGGSVASGCVAWAVCERARGDLESCCLTWPACAGSELRRELMSMVFRIPRVLRANVAVRELIVAPGWLLACELWQRGCVSRLRSYKPSNHG